MTKTLIVSCAIAVVGIAGASDVVGQNDHSKTLQHVQSRLQRIYERGEYRPNTFRGQWLPDSEGYAVMESAATTGKQERARYDLVTGERTVLSDRTDERPGRPGKPSPNRKLVLQIDDGNLHIRDLRTRQMTAMTRDADGESVTNRRAIWSPDSQRVAFVQSDLSRVRSRTMLIPDDPSYPDMKESRFARVGETIPTLRVGVIDVQSDTTRWLSIPEPADGFYLGQVQWAGNSDELLVEKLSRFRDEREFLLADVGTGKISRLFHETDPAWVVASIGKNSGLEWIDDGRAFIVISEQDGWRHAYVYSRDGRQRSLLTPGPFDIIERVKVDHESRWFYFNASPDNATQKYLYRVRLDGGSEPQRVTPTGQPGTHDYRFSPNAKWAFHTYSSFDSPPVVELLEMPEHRVVRVLQKNDRLRKKAGAFIRPTEFLQLDIGDGVVMDAWMMKPADFDPAKKYPVLVYVYGEPHAQTVLDAWGQAHASYHRVVADLGYLVVSIDNRGTPSPKGAAWRRSVFGKLGVLSTEEQAAGVLELGRRFDFVDLSRVAIWGWSGGGSNTLNAVFRRPDIYQLGIAVAAKPQPRLYNAWFQEIYMETPAVNPDGYQEAAPINFAEGLQGDLLIIHGTGETNTHVEIVEGLVDRLIELGKPFDYMTYPNRDHGIRRGKGTEVHLRMHMIRYLLSHLPPTAN